MRLQQLLRFPPAVIRWLFEPRIFWLAVVVTVALLIVAFAGIQDEMRIRSVGATSQLLGICTVAWGLRQARLLFNKPSLWVSIRKWWDRRPRLTQRIITGTGNLSMPAVTASARRNAFAQAGPNDPPDVRLKALEENFRLVNERLNRIETESKQEAARVEALIHTESQKLSAMTDIVSKKLDTSWTGGLYVSMIGLIWLALGTILTAFPNELAQCGS